MGACIRLLVLLLSVAVAGCATSSRVPAPLHFTALGASDALGVGAFPPTRGYVFRIRDSVEQQAGRPVELLNLGIPAGEVGAIETALRTSLQAGNRPDLVTLWTGSNDVTHGADPKEFEATLHNLLQRLRGKTTALVVLANVPDLTRLPYFLEHPTPAVTTARIMAFNAAIERQALAIDAPVVHLYEQPFMEHYVSDLDGFHPSNAGHAAIADLFLRVILPHLGGARIGAESAPRLSALALSGGGFECLSMCVRSDHGHRIPPWDR
jgi:acyl-CoA thioesterase I